MSKKSDAQGGRPWAKNGTGKKESGAAHLFTRNFTPTHATRQELARLGSQAERVALRCPNARQRARFERLARFLLRASRGGRPHG